MKNRKWSLLFVLPLLAALVSCQPTSPSSQSSSLGNSSTGESSSLPSSEESSSSTSSASIVSYALEVLSQPDKTTYTLYDNFEEEGLVIALVGQDEQGNTLTTENFTDYSLSIDGVDLTEETIFTNSGRKTVVVSPKDDSHGDISTSFRIQVNNYLSLNQYLEIEGNLELFHHVGDSLDLSGLSFRLETEKTDVDNNTNTSSTLLSREDVTITLDGKEVEEVTFDAVGRHSLVVSTQGYEQTISKETILYVLEKDDALPETFPSPSPLPEDTERMTVEITTGKGENGKGYIAPDEVEIDYGIYEYGLHAYDDWVYAPSKSLGEETSAKTPFLVVPVVLPGGEEEATEDKRELIYETFFGNGENLEYESLHSYYWKSSYGQLDITGTLTDYFYAKDFTDLSLTGGMTEKKFETLLTGIDSFVKEAYGLDLDDYDSDDDGTVDGIWMVFLGTSSNDQGNFWGLSGSTKWKGTKEDPVFNNYGFIGMDFIDGSYDAGMDEGGDAHVVIHETGHMLGLMDYYAYPSADYPDDTYSPLSGLDVMDGGIMDHNPYSKMLLGWTKPYIVTGDCTITIDSSLAKDALIVIPYDDKTYEVGEDGKYHFNPFDEYLVLDFYSPNGFNAQGYAYAGDEPLDGMGGRLYHVDARLAYGENGSYTLFDDPDDALSYSGKVAKIITNSIRGTASESVMGLSGANSFDEIRWISKDGRLLDYGRNRIDENALFLEGDSFSLTEYGNQFVDGKLDSGKNFTTTFTISAIG